MTAFQTQFRAAFVMSTITLFSANAFAQTGTETPDAKTPATKTKVDTTAAKEETLNSAKHESASTGNDNNENFKHAKKNSKTSTSNARPDP